MNKILGIHTIWQVSDTPSDSLQTRLSRRLSFAQGLRLYTKEHLRITLFIPRHLLNMRNYATKVRLLFYQTQIFITNVLFLPNIIAKNGVWQGFFVGS